jgi:hypothetical protein
MMQNDIESILSDILAQWHRWACGYQYVGGINSSPMFRETKSGKGWDTIDEIVDSEIEGGRMAAVNFHVMDMEPCHRTALQIQARNLHTGKSVWDSPRLPQDAEERAVLLLEARNRLFKRLLAAGVL